MGYILSYFRFSSRANCQFTQSLCPHNFVVPYQFTLEENLKYDKVN